MHITALEIRNFRGIKYASIEDAGSAVVIAGPNGSGKSCILDAIRLLKSAYGSYEQSELDLWSNEFQLRSRGQPSDFRALLRNKAEPLTIQATVEVSLQEQRFLLGEGVWMLRELTWKDLFPTVPTTRGQLRSIASRTDLEKLTAVEQEVAKRLEQLRNDLTHPLQGAVTVPPVHHASYQPCLALRLLFGFFVPDKMGIVDYHGSDRKYAREQLSSIPLLEVSDDDTVKNSALYNYEQKYANLKAAMASEFVREQLQQAAGARRSATPSLATTLSELFRTFLPGKRFRGPVPSPSGELTFPVDIDETTRHDINELSSGEKEILFAYLRARTLSPKQSVLLIDEPELHLNPGLVQGLPQFYEKTIGRDLDNQIWLVTHSDRFLREALDTAGMVVFHMQHATSTVTGNQLRRIDSQSSVESLFIDLVGDLASYGPGSRVVLLEGDGSRFDQKMVCRLFPDAATTVNFISVGSKSSVTDLLEKIERISEQTKTPTDVFHIVDPDRTIWDGVPHPAGNRLSWTVYHIENYLLDAHYISDALHQIHIDGYSALNASDVDLRLKAIAESLIEDLAVRSVRETLSRRLKRSVEIRLNGNIPIENQLLTGISNAVAGVETVQSELGTSDAIRQMLNQQRRKFRRMWTTDDWRTHFPGREILTRFCGSLECNTRYETLRNVVISEMARQDHRPPAMAEVIRYITEPDK